MLVVKVLQNIPFLCEFSFNYKNQSKKNYANNKRHLCISKDQLNID